ncbi:hypothetical protein BDK51DRAFT_35029 [Blyttiomyces helicus]|uniref:Uncharacterized protein n=1 Tax=Blyttiomyces helicus TaxID=388810 RepID=A0A4P9WFC8_9FUNG|nr:hypothetical protein BDK51DRAFT_35029 [Blyttiomyces helicus]|eukprot:RKO91441.1 hypothetical protein BDK51DRAFT_35029 [Blyttiomyces helicus]
MNNSRCRALPQSVKTVTVINHWRDELQLGVGHGFNRKSEGESGNSTSWKMGKRRRREMEDGDEVVDESEVEKEVEARKVINGDEVGTLGRCQLQEITTKRKLMDQNDQAVLEQKKKPGGSFHTLKKWQGISELRKEILFVSKTPTCPNSEVYREVRLQECRHQNKISLRGDMLNSIKQSWKK